MLGPILTNWISTAEVGLAAVVSLPWDGVASLTNKQTSYIHTYIHSLC